MIATCVHMYVSTGDRQHLFIVSPCQTSVEELSHTDVCTSLVGYEPPPGVQGSFGRAENTKKRPRNRDLPRLTLGPTDFIRTLLFCVEMARTCVCVAISSLLCAEGYRHTYIQVLCPRLFSLSNAKTGEPQVHTYGTQVLFRV